MRKKLTMPLMTLIFLLIAAAFSAQGSLVDSYKKVENCTVESAPPPTLVNDVLIETKVNGTATEQAVYNQLLTGKTKFYDMTDTKISHMHQPNKSITNPITPITSTRAQATSVSVRALQSKNVGDGEFSPDGTTTRAHAAKSFLNS